MKPYRTATTHRIERCPCDTPATPDTFTFLNSTKEVRAS